ncbi:MAG: glycosyltransferase family 4 protein [Syntrophomonas sp.]
MIVLFTSNSQGGILQFTRVLAKAFQKTGHDVTLFCPDGAESFVSDAAIVRYHRVKTLFHRHPKIRGLTDQVLAFNPTMAIFTDDVTTSAAVAINVSRAVPTAICIHDITPHLTNDVVHLLRRRVNLLLIKRSYGCVDHIICLSSSGKAAFKKLYAEYEGKTFVMPLGAHLVTEEQVRPGELHESIKYVLFFGRIDAYKGVDFLVEEFTSHPLSDDIKLVIAGKGAVDKATRAKMKTDRILFLNRFIRDEEMNWLFSHCITVVLPYKEASQSGVLPIAYHYGKPVLVSDLPGLTENVIENETGLIYRNKNEFSPKLRALIEHAEGMKSCIVSYADRHLNWGKNVGELIRHANIGKN